MLTNAIRYLFLLMILFLIMVRVEGQKPNFIIIYTDDQGYQDLSCFQSPDIKTPNIDLLASEGILATDFYVSASVCSASRASLLTGKYPQNSGVGGVFFPDSPGMESSQITIAEKLQAYGYNTSCFGKWHLGDLKGHLPTDQGFDSYFGIPYSNDMYIGKEMKFAEHVQWNNDYTLQKAQADQLFCFEHRKDRSVIKKSDIVNFVPILEQTEVVEYPCDQSTLTQRYFDRAIQTIEASNGEVPFFIYLTPAMPHVPLFSGDAFRGKSEAGLYGDVIEEIDYHVGRLKAALVAQGLDKNTAIIYASDNGPWLGYKDHAGRAKPLRDGKFSNYEGGVRVPSIFHWPGVWQNGVVIDDILSTIDIFPTIAAYAGAESSTDGFDLSEFLEGKNATCPRSHFIYSRGKEIHGIRMGDWKLLLYSGQRNSDKKSAPELYNLKLDIFEKKNVYDHYPQIVKQLMNELEKRRIELSGNV